MAPYASTACVISFVIAGHRSVYPSQILSIKKSSSIDVELGAKLNNLKPSFQQREKSLIGLARSLMRFVSRGRKDEPPGCFFIVVLKKDRRASGGYPGNLRAARYPVMKASSSMSSGAGLPMR